MKVSPWLRYLIVLRFLSDVFCFVFRHEFHSVFPVFHVSVFLETLCYLFYFRELSGSKNKQYLLVILMFMVVVGIDMGEGLWLNNYWSTLFSTLLIPLFSLRFLLVPVEPSKDQVSILIPMFIFHTSMFTYTLFENIIRENTQLFNSLQPFILVLILLYNLSLAYFIWKNRKKTTLSSQGIA
jgi:hypothetical protein